jgi:hypothetical protein
MMPLMKANNSELNSEKTDNLVHLAIKRKSIKRFIARAEKLNDCDYELLTDHEVCCLLKYTNEKPPIVSMLNLLSLLMGRTIENLLDESTGFVKPPESAANAGFGFIVVDRPYASQHLNKGLACSGTFSIGYIPIPRELVQHFSDIKEPQLNEEAIQNIVASAKKFLTDINFKEGTRLSPARIARHLRWYCAHHSISEVCYAAVTGKAMGFHAGIHYTEHENWQIIGLLTRYGEYLRSLNPAFKLTFPVPTKEVRWGSQRVPNKNDVSKYFKDLYVQAKKRARQLDLLTSANCYVAYTLGVLQLATGHRPERDAFGDLSAFDLRYGYIFIDDKESGHNHRRIIKLCSVAHQQLLNFVEHIQLLMRIAKFQFPDITSEAQKILDGKNPLLSYIRNEKFNFASPLSPPSGQLPVLPGENNYYRHLLRTYFEQVGLATDLADWFMGHEGKCDHSFGSYSSLELEDSKMVASSVEALFYELGISAQTSPLLEI